MPINRNALIRYKTIDNCLKNRFRQWTLDDLIDACSDALYEYEGIDKGVSRRTVQMDIQMMRSEKLGYNAPIVVIDKKFYTYEDPDYSITNIPLTDQDLNKLTEVVDILKQFKGFTHFKELSGMVQKLEDKIHTTKTDQRSIIDLDKNDNLKGLEYIDPIYQSILKKKCIEITYKSFRARKANTFVFHPYLLKEHRNRWFVFGSRSEKKQTLLLALDRIESLSENNKAVGAYDEEWAGNYFKDVIGVTVNEGQEPVKVELLIGHAHAPYVITKPLHHSQKVIGKTEEGVRIVLLVQHNFELERDILALGDQIKVISPSRLKNNIKERLQHALDGYLTELSTNELRGYKSKLDNKGSLVLENFYSNRRINQIKKAINHYFDEKELKQNETLSIRKLFKEVPALIPLCFNNNLKQVLESFGEDLFLTKAIYFNKAPQSNWYVTWHQDLPINVSRKIETEGYQGWTKKDDVISVIPPKGILDSTITIRIHLDETTARNGALKVIPGSHKNIHDDQTIGLISKNSAPFTAEVKPGGIHIMKPLILHASSKSVVQKQRRVIHLEFNDQNLDGALIWDEKEVI